MKYKLIYLFLLTLLLPALACNFPTSSPHPGSDSDIDQFKTQSAYIFATLQANQQQTGSPSTSSPLSIINVPPFAGLQTATSEPVQQTKPAATLVPSPIENGDVFTYQAQSGDTLVGLEGRFGVNQEQIASQQPLPQSDLIPPGTLLIIANTIGKTLYPSALLPDSEVIDSPSAKDFNVQEFIQSQGGFLASYQEEVNKQLLSGADIVQRVAFNTSTNPRLLLAVLDYRSHWVTGQPIDPSNLALPLGFYVPEYKGLYLELSLAAKQLNIAYYGWRQGTQTQLDFPSGSSIRLSPGLNAGSVALQMLFSKFYSQSPWADALYGPDNFPNFYQKMFGEPWERAASIEPLFPPALAQPALELPFTAGEQWSLTAGPHPAWNTGTPLGALDFAPVTGEPPCAVSRVWVTASAPGLVVRSADGAVMVDLDSDGYEQTGWDLLYMHVAARDRVAVGTRLNTDDHIGHPSCEGGDATGTHVHVARKYNGEWISAASPLVFELSGWLASPGGRIYEGYLTKGSRIVTAHPDGSSQSTIIR